jgi:penicillin amidase
MRPLLLSLSLLASGCAGSALLGYRLSPDYPDDTAAETLQLSGLKQPVLVTLDAWGIPHLEAQDLVDLARATGYMQGRNRFFEMDMMRRFAKGRVSELVGEQPLLSETTLDYDRVMRGWELEARSQIDLNKMNPEQAQVLTAFAEGVNAAVKKHKPLEYRLLLTDPEPWVPTDSIAVGLLNVWSVSHNWTQEMSRLLLALSVGQARAERIYPNDAPLGGRTLPGSPSVKPLPPAIAPELEGMFAPKVAPASAASSTGLGLDPLAMLGASNAWVVDGRHTVSGSPMVANDPHLTHLLPSIMFQLHLKAPNLDVIGVTVPGLPWVLAGHNERVAWGITSTVADVIDLVIEKVDPAHPAQVVTDAAEPCPISVREEQIGRRVGGEIKHQPVILRTTCHGPVLNDLYPRLLAGAPLVSIRWRTEHLERSFEVLLAMNRARSTEEMGAVIADLPATYNTWTVADVDGHIGTFLSGSVPVHEQARGTFPVPGWLEKYDWTHWAKGRELPWAMDPESGMLAHANNLMVEPGAEPFVTPNVDAAPSYRHDRIEVLLRATPRHDLATFRRTQSDVFSLRARAVLPKMLEDLSDGAELSERARKALRLLKLWNYETSPDRAAPTIFFAVYRMAVQAALRDELGEEAQRFFLSQRYSTNAADAWFEDPQHPVWDDLTTPEIETRATIVNYALEAAVVSLGAQLGDDPAKWQWGKVHRMRPMHAFGEKLLLDGTLNLESFEAGGELDSVWKSHFDLGNEKAPFKVVAGPVFRMVVDLADLKNDAWWVVDTGSSGWPKSPHYGDQFEHWRQGELIPMWTDLTRVNQAEHGTITFSP